MDKKLKEMILYVADKCKEDPSFGATKLNKILFLADMNCYALKGSSITDGTYMHKQNGPVAKRMLPACHALITENRAKEEETVYFGHTKRRIVPLTGFDGSLFSEDELSLVDAMIEQTRHLTASQLSQWSHTLNPWLLTVDGEDIPYESAYVLYNLPVEEDGLAWGKKELKRLKLAA